MLSRRTVLSATARLVALVFLLSLSACGPAGPADDALLDLAARVPGPIAELGVHLRRGADGHGRLLDALGLDPDQVRAVGETTAPALRVLTGSGFDAVADRLAEMGFVPRGVGIATDQDLELLERPDGLPGFVGMPAVAILTGVSSAVDGVDDVIAVGDLNQLDAVAGQTGALDLFHEALVGADAALAGVRDGTVVALTSGTDDPESPTAGSLLLRFDDPVDQAAAVAAAVALRTLSAESLEQPWMVGAPLATGSIVTVPLEWTVTGPEFLREGLDTDLLGDIVRQN